MLCFGDDQVRGHEKARAAKLVADLLKDERARSRDQTNEILGIYSYGKSTCDEVLAALTNDDDDGAQ